MKHKLLLFLLFFSSLGNVVIAQSAGKSKSNSSVNSGLPNTLKTGKTKAIIPAPLVTAGSACKEESASNITVVMAASGGSGDIIEWFGDQTSSTILHSGAIYSPSIGKTTTYYVWSRSGADYSIRVPVVASVFVLPPTVTLTVSPTESTICEGTFVTFTANGGADLFEFSVNGIVTQAMSVTKTYTTSTLKKGQTVSVRTRYGITLDGILTERAWGKGLAEDNVQSASLSPDAANSYINGVKISPTEKELVFGLPGNLENGSSILLFLDTKPLGFNIANFGDVASMSPTVRGFNFFNNNLSTFDSYFDADYCLVIAKDDLGTSYLSDVIELKTGTSIIGSPKPIMSVKEGNLGINDYDNGFEVSVLKSLIGYNQGDIKFFAFTMQNDIVTNSFLSPELSSSADYGNGFIDFNIKDPNPVAISANALIPCYKEASLLISLVEPPTAATAGPDQFNCTFNSSSLRGNSPTIGTGVWTLKSGPGAVTFSDALSGTSTATVNTEGIYIFTWTITNGTCPPSTADINVEFKKPVETPILSSVTQSTCSVATGSFTITNYDASYVYTASPSVGVTIAGNMVTAPAGSYTITATLGVCSSVASASNTVNAQPITPVQPTLSSVTHPTCSVATGSFSITNYDASYVYTASPSIGVTISGNTVTAPAGSYTITATLGVCSSVSSASNTVNAQPITPAQPTLSSVIQPTCSVATGSFTITNYDAAYIYTVSPSVGVSVSGDTVTAAKGTYTITATLGACTSVASASNTVNTQPVTPVQPTLSSVTQPTCSVATGSFTITNYDASYVYTASPSVGVTISGNTVTAPAGSYTITATLGVCSSVASASNTVNAQPITPAQPILSSVTQPTCSVVTGSFTITNYDASYVYTVSPSVGVSVSGDIVTAPKGTYIITATLGACTSVASTSNTVNTQPITPVEPTLSSVTQPSCSVATGSFTITNYDTSYVYTSSPSVGVTISGNTVTAPAGSYIITATLGVCSSVASASNTVDMQPITPAQPTLSSVIQPTCSVGTGNFTITNYDASYVYTVSPSVGVLVSGNTVTAPAGTYTITVTFGLCQVSTNTIINAQPVTPTQPILSSVTQPTCSVATGSFTITNYDASYVYTASPSVGVTISGNTVTAPAGSYTITATLGVCSSQASASNTVNMQPITPATPTLSSVTQPTCSVGIGSFTITNYDASYVYTISPSVGVLVSGNTVTAPAGTYTITVTFGLCQVSTNTIINAQPVTPTQPILSSVTQPTCSVATGSFTITNYDASYVYTASPSVGVLISGNTVTAPNGTYTITATLGLCSSVASAINTVNAQPNSPTQPTLSSVTQPTCSVATGSFTITNYDASYVYTISPSAGVLISGNAVTAPVGTYAITATLGSCQLSTNTTVNAQPVTPAQPTLSSVTQPTCSVATGSFTITNYNASNIYTASPSVGVTISGNTVTAPKGTYTITATLGLCSSNASVNNTVNAPPSVPTQPTLSVATQPTCTVSTGSFKITNYDASYTYSVNPSTGVLISGNTITALSGNYTVTATLGLCATSATVTINPIPAEIQFVIAGNCEEKEYVLTTSPMANSYDPNNVSYQWKDSSGSPVGTNSNILNVSDVIASTFAKEVFPLNYTLTIVSTATGCQTTKAVTVETIFCNIQKGISPDGNGSNDYFDLRLMDVRKLEIFNRYGIKVYEQSNYTDQWKGQSDKGENLPSATYYYVIELNKGETKTGWIYLIREK